MPKFFVVRVDRDPKDTHAASSLQHAVELANPDEGSLIEFAEVSATDAGAARLMRPQAWLYVHDYRPPMTPPPSVPAAAYLGADGVVRMPSAAPSGPNEYDEGLIDEARAEGLRLPRRQIAKLLGMKPPRGRRNPSVGDSDVGVVARTLFVAAWADWAEENGELRGTGGSDLFDLAPETPDAAEQCAAGIIERVELLNGASWGELYELAKNAPGKHYRKPKPEDFAYGLTMQMMGHGVSWFDDHPKFPIKLPSVDAHWDGEEFDCTTSGGRNPA